MKRQVPANQTSIFHILDSIPKDQREFIGFHKGDKLLIINGQHKGRTGIYFKHCSKAFPEWCRVALDLKGRERSEKIVMMFKTDIKVIG